MMHAVSAITPIFSCAQRTLPLSGILGFPLPYKFADVGIGRTFQPVLIAFEDQPALAHDHENRLGALPGPVFNSIQASLFRIVAEIRNEISVLIAVGHHQRGGMAEIPLL